jgi:uncharacterized protein
MAPTPSPPAASVEPVPDEPAAVATTDEGRALLIADYHAGYEAGLRYERGVDVPSHAPERRERLRALLERTAADRLVVLGDVMHSIGDPGGAERGELETLLESIPSRIDVTVVKGNHDGGIDDWLADATIVSGEGTTIGAVGVCHGHTWPAAALLETDILCLGHEHPCVRLEDEVGGSRAEPIWLRGRLDPTPFRDQQRYDAAPWSTIEDDPPTLVVFPAFNELAGGTWVNVPGQTFLSPFLPDGIADGEAYLLDGTRLGAYDRV